MSAFARLKNGDQFLEKCLLSIKDYVDEVILLVDINSTDNTSKICQKLSKKYPNIFKYYEYEPEVYP
ncbi:MAG: glycosyltransferase family 2 protein [Candidatus Peribacteria bacterium]|nr:glycosyltransferase family 2 protein [Candidatus Peribacteria bacterium]